MCWKIRYSGIKTAGLVITALQENVISQNTRIVSVVFLSLIFQNCF